MIKTITKSPTTGRSIDGKSKSPRSNLGSVKRSARESTPGRPNDQDPDAALEKLVSKAGAGSTPEQLPMLDDRLRRVDHDDADNSDIIGAAHLRTSRGKRDSSQQRGKYHENMVDIGETEEQQDVVKRMKAVCLECFDGDRQKILDSVLIEELKNRLVLSGKQATHLIGNVNLLGRHIEEKEREMAQTIMVDEALPNDLTMKLDGQSEQSRRLEENLERLERLKTMSKWSLGRQRAN